MSILRDNIYFFRGTRSFNGITAVLLIQSHMLQLKSSLFYVRASVSGQQLKADARSCSFIFVFSIVLFFPYQQVSFQLRCFTPESFLTDIPIADKSKPHTFSLLLCARTAKIRQKHISFLHFIS